VTSQRAARLVGYLELRVVVLMQIDQTYPVNLSRRIEI
jgi:hypothetical protein